MKLSQVWFGPPATEQQLASIRKISPTAIVDDLVRFYRRHDGVERSFESVDYSVDRFDSLRIYESALATDPEMRRSLDESFPGYWAIGGDAGGQTIAYDMQAEHPWPLVLILPGDTYPPAILARNLEDLAEKYFKSDSELQIQEGEQDVTPNA